MLEKNFRKLQQGQALLSLSNSNFLCVFSVDFIQFQELGYKAAPFKTKIGFQIEEENARPGLIVICEISL